MAAGPRMLSAALALLAATAMACRRSEDAPRAPAGLTFTLLDDGREPRQELRYPDQPPPAQKLSLDLSVGMKMEAPGSPIPPVSLPGLRLTLEIESRRAEGAVRYEFTISDADLTNAENAQASLLAEMRKGLDAIVGTTGAMVVEPRGFRRELAIAMPAALGPELAQFMNSAKLAIGQMVVPLPAEPVGVGAKWEVVETIVQDGLRVREKTYFELVELEGARALVRTQTVQSADRQRAVLPGLPAGVTAEVLSLRGSGGGQIELDLRRLVPGTAREEVETDVSFAVRQGQDERVMSLTAQAGLEIQAL